MKKNKFKRFFAIVLMLAITCYGYLLLYNRVFSGYEARGAHIWLSASTVKFVNNWLKEDPVNLKFIMYENLDSIEFNNLNERGAYISYPPGAILPPYILAKLLNKEEIQVSFIKNFLAIKYLFDTLLVCLIFYSFFLVILRLNHHYYIIISSIILSLLWMCLPINQYYLRNVYFSDHAIITVVLLFVLFEIYNDSIRNSLFKYVFIFLKILVSLYGVLTDWYFLFVIFICWLVKLITMIRSKEKVLRATLSSLVYVLPVIFGIGLFFLQISTVPDYYNKVINIVKFRTFTNHIGNNQLIIIKHFFIHYTIYCFLLLILFCLIVILAKHNLKNNSDKYYNFFKFLSIIYIPPFFHILIFQNHSAIHDFSLLKFALPIILTIPIIVYCILDIKKLLLAKIIITQLENNNKKTYIKAPLFYLIILISSIILIFTNTIYQNHYYLETRIYSNNNEKYYELEYLIRENYNYNDVYFSFTETLDENPPEHLAISKKRIYKIEKLDDIYRRFPSLNHDARILLLINNDYNNKTEEILEKEQYTQNSTQLAFYNKNYYVYNITDIVFLDNTRQEK